MATVELVIFDMDGVLADLCEIHRKAFRQALALNGINLTPDREVELEGRPTAVKLALLGVGDDIAAEVKQAKQDLTLDALSELKVDPPKIEALKWLRSRGIKTAVYTNSVRQTALLALENMGLLEHLDLITSNQEVTSPKPDPEGYLLTMQKMQVSAERTLILEDSPVGLEAAIWSGAAFIQVVRSPDEVSVELFQKWITA